VGADAVFDTSGQGRVAGSITGVIVRQLRTVAGDEGVARALEIASVRQHPDELEDPASWSSYNDVVALFKAGIEVTGEADFPLRCGEETLNQYAGTEVTALLRSLGSPGAVLRNIAVTVSKFTTVHGMEALEIGDDHAVVCAWPTGGLRQRPPTSCAYTAGLLSQASPLFGMDPAEVVETQCQSRGDDVCVYEVRWDPSSSPEADPQRRMEYLEAQLAALTERLDSLQDTANEIVATDIDAVLEAVTRRAGLAIRAPRYLLAVSFDRDDLRLHHHGFDDEGEAGAVAREVLAEQPDDCGGSRLIVDVTSRGRRFGRLAALYPEGARFFPAERRLLEAYAANAAAALEPAAALDEARRQNRTSHALLTLASSLAEVTTSAEVARRLAEVVPSVVECGRAAVLLWDGEAEVLRYAGMSGYDEHTEARLRGLSFGRGDVPEVEQMVRSPEPTVVDVDTASPLLREVLDIKGVPAVTGVPIRARGEFFGIVAADLDHSAAGPDTVERLEGMASQAATALQNARLLEQVRHQALHDPLTGLPNRTLLADRAMQALSAAPRTGARVGFLFLDLDEFKTVNDNYGHGCGDVLLQRIAERLATAVRKSDTVARVGGDEFVFLLTDLTSPDEAERVAMKILDLFDTPFEVDGREIGAAASIGVAVAGPADDYEALLKQSDAAMYAAKASGGERVMNSVS
jgi:diguanylate cyclase (GGDEF)-like protein